MEAGEERIFKAQMTMLPATVAFIDAFCARNGIGRADALRLTLVVEELFTNTVTHGFRGDSDASIRVLISVEADVIALLYEDAAPRHDPLSRLAAAAGNEDSTIGSRPIGGLGILLVTQIAVGARYAHEDGCNRLWLRLPFGR